MQLKISKQRKGSNKLNYYKTAYSVFKINY